MNETLKQWVKGMLKEWVPDLVAEFLGVRSMKKILTRGRETADQKAEEGVKTEGKKFPDVKFGGILNDSDETAFFGLMSELKKNEAVSIAAFINTFEHDWQRRRFRAAVGELAQVEFTADWKMVEKAYYKETTQRHHGAPNLKERTEYDKAAEVRTNLGIQFLKSFAKYSPEEKLDICKASGILDSRKESVIKAWKQIEKWADEHGDEAVALMNKATTTLGGKVITEGSMQRKSLKPYKGFWRELLRLPAKKEKEGTSNA